MATSRGQVASVPTPLPSVTASWWLVHPSGKVRWMPTREPAAPRASAVPLPGWRGALIALAIASAVGLVLATQLILFSNSVGLSIPWAAALAGGFSDTWPWVPLVPAIFALSRRLDASRWRWPAQVAVHLLGALAAAVLYSSLQIALTQWVLPEDLRPMSFFRGPPPGNREIRRGHPPGPGGPGPGPVTPGDKPPPPRGRERFRPPSTFAERLEVTTISKLHLHLLTYAAMVGCWHWLAQQRRLRERERQAQELSRQLAEARLQALRMQLNPHFLFNTLNGIATLLHRDARAADEMIACLSDFLRLTLSAANLPENPLQRELEFARRYLDIEKARFGDRLTVEEEIAEECLPIAVPTLVLQPLLENAVRHGIESVEGSGRIHVAARRDGDFLDLTVSDSGPGLAVKPSSRSGIGLANTRARLRELHGDDATLTLSDRPGGGLRVSLRLPWRAASGTSTPAT